MNFLCLCLQLPFLFQSPLDVTCVPSPRGAKGRGGGGRTASAVSVFSRLQCTEHTRHTKAQCFSEEKKRGECRGRLNHLCLNLSGGGGRTFRGRWLIVVFSLESLEANFYIIVASSFILFPGARGCSSVIFPHILIRSFIMVLLLWYRWSSSWWMLMFSVAVATHLLAVAVPVLHSFRNLLFVDLINYLAQKDLKKKKKSAS